MVITVRRRVRSYPPRVLARFGGDPAAWLPQPLTMHGVHEFRAPVRAWPSALMVTYTVSGVWRRGDVWTRRLVMTVRRGEDLPLFRRVTGELTAEARVGGVRLRYRAAVERLEGRWSWLLPARLHARLVASVVLRQIAANLEVAPPPVAPSRAAKRDPP